MFVTSWPCQWLPTLSHFPPLQEASLSKRNRQSYNHKYALYGLLFNNPPLARFLRLQPKKRCTSWNSAPLVAARVPSCSRLDSTTACLFCLSLVRILTKVLRLIYIFVMTYVADFSISDRLHIVTGMTSPQHVLATRPQQCAKQPRFCFFFF